MNVQNLSGVIPDKILSLITPDFLSKASIDGPKRLSNFLGQTEEETGNFTAEVENLNYSAQALLATWPKHFADLADANNYARQPEKIANRVYANRMGNGDEASGDGWKYRGRGDLQITGKDNYQAFQNWVDDGLDPSEQVDFINNPDLVATPPYDLLSAAWYFNVNNLWPICDGGVDDGTITKVTEKVNGGTNGLSLRIAYTTKIYSALTAA